MDVCVFVVVCNRFSAPRLSIVLAAPTLTKPNTHSQCPNGSNLNRHEKEVETIDGKTGYGVLCHRLNGRIGRKNPERDHVPPVPPVHWDAWRCNSLTPSTRSLSQTIGFQRTQQSLLFGTGHFTLGRAWLVDAGWCGKLETSWAAHTPHKLGKEIECDEKKNFL